MHVSTCVCLSIIAGLSLCLHSDCLCASSCVVKYGGVCLYAHYSPLSLVSSISLAALRHYPSPRSLYEYLTKSSSFSALFTLLLLFSLPYSYPLSFLFVSLSCKSFLHLFPSHPSVCQSLSISFAAHRLLFPTEGEEATATHPAP